MPGLSGGVQQAGRGCGADEQPRRRRGQRPGQQRQEREGVAQGTEGRHPDQPAPVGQPAAKRPGRGLAQRVPGHDQARHRHRRVLGRHQQ
jgi:hypothetical protein